jgi:hypothetical protein
MGRMFLEDTHTVILSLHGAGIVSNYKLIAEQELTLRSKETNLEAEIRIVGEIGSEDGRYMAWRFWTTSWISGRWISRPRVVTCIDMSRGGLGFRTKNAYAISTEVTVAVPLSPESPPAPALYVPARVGEYCGVAGIENVPVWRGVFARGGNAAALLKKISWLAPRLFWLRRSRNFLHRWQGLCRPWRANRWRAVRGGGRCA